MTGLQDAPTTAYSTINRMIFKICERYKSISWATASPVEVYPFFRDTYIFAYKMSIWQVRYEEFHRNLKLRYYPIRKRKMNVEENVKQGVGQSRRY